MVYMYLLKQIHDGVEKQANNSLRSQGLTLAQVGALIELRSIPEKQLTLKELEKRLHVAQSTAAGIVARLEQKGLIEGFGDANDRRIKMLRITSAGEACCQLADQRMAESEALLLSGLTDVESTLFLSLLEKVANNLK
jgi:DNA-binding MarR family transcriptional regulator